MKQASNIIKGLLIAVIFTLVLIFSIQNLIRVPISFLNNHSVEIPLFVIIFGVFFLGILIGYLAGLLSGSKVSKRKIGEINITANEQIAEMKAKLQQEDNTKISE